MAWRQSSLLVLVMTIPSLVARVHGTYHTNRLYKICSHGRKTRIQLSTGAHLFTLNSSHLTASSPSFSCHLELSVSSPDYGFFIFIEEMSLSGSAVAGCSEDFLQFGRDILFVTTHLSVRYCGEVERPRMKTNLAVTTSHISQRTYTEYSDTEMDIWLHIKLLPGQAGPHKSLTLLVTPVRLRCGGGDALFMPCGLGGGCVRRELWCDGMVNCPPDGGVWPDEHNCPSSPNSSEDSQLHYLTSSLVISGVVLIPAFLLVIVHVASSYRRTKQFHTTVQETLENDSHSSESDLPDPPSYTAELRLGRSYQYCDV